MSIVINMEEIPFQEHFIKRDTFLNDDAENNSKKKQFNFQINPSMKFNTKSIETNPKIPKRGENTEEIISKFLKKK